MSIFNRRYQFILKVVEFYLRLDYGNRLPGNIPDGLCDLDSWDAKGTSPTSIQTFFGEIQQSMFAIKACVRGSLCLRLQFFLKTRYDSGTEIVVITEVPNIREFSP